MTTLAQHVDTASEAVRSANHATMRGRLPATDACVVVGNLVELESRLPQLLDYLARSLWRAEPAEYRDDRGTWPAHTLREARAHIEDACSDLALVTGQLSAAHGHLGHLALLDPED